MFLSKLLALTGCVGASFQSYFGANPVHEPVVHGSNGRGIDGSSYIERDSFLDNLVANMTVSELGEAFSHSWHDIFRTCGTSLPAPDQYLF